MKEDERTTRMDFAKFILEHNLELISLIDSKASIIIGIDGVVMALLFGLPHANISTKLVWPVAAAVGLLALSALFSFLTLMPRTTEWTPDTRIFWRSIVKKKPEMYVTELQSASVDEILVDYSNNIYALASIQRVKFKFIRLALYSLILAFVLLVLTLMSTS